MINYVNWERAHNALCPEARTNRSHSKKTFSFNSFEKVVFIQRIRKSSPYSTHLKKPFSFNSFEKAVFIQLIWKSRSHSTQSKKPFSFNPVEKAVLIQPSRKSRSHLTQSKKSFSFVGSSLRWWYGSMQYTYLRLIKLASERVYMLGAWITWLR